MIIKQNQLQKMGYCIFVVVLNSVYELFFFF